MRSMPSSRADVWVSSQSNTPPASSRPGGVVEVNQAVVAIVDEASSTWRVVDGAFFTSPKVLSRKSVRKSEVLPVWMADDGKGKWGGHGLWAWVDRTMECVSMEPFIFSGNISFRRP